MPGKGPKNFNCTVCNVQTKANGNDRRPVSTEHKYIIERHLGKTVNDESVICNKCRHKCRTFAKKKTKHVNAVSWTQKVNDNGPSTRPATIHSPPSVSLPFPCTPKGHSVCCLCKRAGPKLIVMTTQIRHQVFMEREILIPAGSRCCPNHIYDNRVSDTALNDIRTVGDRSELNRSSVADLLRFMRTTALRHEKTRLDFDGPNGLKEEEYLTLLGISKDSFLDLFKYVQDQVRNTPARSARTSLAIFLMKMRSGLSNKIMSTIFNVSKSSIRRCLSSVRTALKGFVGENLGFQHITRESVIQNHTRKLAQTLFGDIGESQVILVLDGTYIYTWAWSWCPANLLHHKMTKKMHF